MAALTITINGTDRTTSCQFASVEIVTTIAANTDHAAVIVSVAAGAGWRPEAGNEIVVAEGATTHYGGIIIAVTERNVDNNRLLYELDCRDYIHLLDRRLVAQEYSTAQPASTIVADVVASFATGFTTTNVQVSPNVPAQNFDYVAISDVIRKLADIVGYGWYVSETKDVHFYSLATETAPVAAIDLDTDTTNYGDLVLHEDVTQVRNRVYVKGWKQKSSLNYSRSYTGDGATSFYSLDWEPSSNSTGDFSVTVSGAAKTAGVDVVDGVPGSTVSTYDGLICFDNMGFRFLDPPANGAPIAFAFNYMTPGFTQVEDTASQTEMASREGGDGIHEFVMDDPGLTADDGSEELAQAKGNVYLSRYSMPRITGSFKSFTQGWRAGQQFVITSTKRMNGIATTVYTQQVTKKLYRHASGGTPLWISAVEFADAALAI